VFSVVNLNKLVYVNDVQNYSVSLQVQKFFTEELYIVGGFSEGECLDNFMDFLVEKGFNGFYWTMQELIDHDIDEDENNLYCCGNHGYFLELNYLSMVFK
jgi:hypothetical protein